MIKSIQLLSIALVAVMALTVVSAAGALKAQASSTDPTSAEIADALDCSSLGWTFTPSHNDMAEVWLYSYPSLPGPNDNVVDLIASCGSAQVQTTALAAGQVTFSWYLYHGKEDITGQFWVGDTNAPATATASRDTSYEYEFFTVGPINVAKGDVLTWRFTAPTDTGSPEWLHLDYLRFTPTADTTPPTVEAGGPYAAGVNEALTFAATASDPSTPLTYSWAFGDGTTSTALNPTHTYAKAGTYTAILTVTDSAGNSASDTATVTVNPTKASVVKDVQSVQATVVTLSSSNFVSKNAQQGMTHDLYSAIKTINAGQYSKAITQLRATLAKTDGCAITGKPDKNDVINNCAAQGQVYPQLVYVIKELNTLQ